MTCCSLINLAIIALVGLSIIVTRSWTSLTVAVWLTGWPPEGASGSAP